MGAGAIGCVLVRRGSYDLVHAHQGEDLALLPLCRLAAWWRRCSWVVTVHCSLAFTYRAKGLRQQLIKAYGGWLERRLLPRAHAVITLTDEAAAHLAAVGVDATALRVIPSGVEVGAYRQPHPDPFAHISRPRVVYIGRLTSQKSVHALIDAFARLEHPQAHSVVVGDGPDRAALEALTARHGLGGWVVFTGFPARAVISGVLRHTDVLVLPSRYEELGSVLVEGLAAGVPIVASRVGGIPSVIDHGRSGLLVPPGDADALARCLGDVLRRPALAARLADGARSQPDRYDWERLAGEVLEVYQTAADRCARRPVCGK